MPITTLQTRLTDELYQILDETFENVHGIYLDKGTSLFETLEPITAEVASRPIGAHCMTIAAHMIHTLFYLGVLERDLRGEEFDKIDWEQTWHVREVTPKHWAELKQDLKETYARIMTFLRNAETWDGEHEIAGALAIVAHTAYHLGALRLALCVLDQIAD